jgi:hypothetical protein
MPAKALLTAAYPLAWRPSTMLAKGAGTSIAAQAARESSNTVGGEVGGSGNLT